MTPKIERQAQSSLQARALNPKPSGKSLQLLVRGLFGRVSRDRRMAVGAGIFVDVPQIFERSLIGMRQRARRENADYLFKTCGLVK